MLRTFLALEAIADLAYGVIILTVPEQFLALYGRSTDTTGIYLLRFLGAAFIGFSVIFWMARDFTEVRALRGVVLGIFVASILGTVVSLLDQLAGNANALGWTSVALTLSFGVGAAYFAFGPLSRGEGPLRS